MVIFFIDPTSSHGSILNYNWLCGEKGRVVRGYQLMCGNIDLVLPTI